MVMRSFRSDCREAYVISYSYGMGDPLDSRFREAGRTAEGGGITRPQLFEMTRPGDSEPKKRFQHHSPAVHLSYDRILYALIDLMNPILSRHQIVGKPRVNALRVIQEGDLFL